MIKRVILDQSKPIANFEEKKKSKIKNLQIAHLLFPKMEIRQVQETLD